MFPIAFMWIASLPNEEPQVQFNSSSSSTSKQQKHIDEFHKLTSPEGINKLLSSQNSNKSNFK